MNSAEVRQLGALSDLFAHALALCRPATVAVLGIAGGNGLEHIDGRVTRRVVGLDVNPVYLGAVRERYSMVGGLELYCASIWLGNSWIWNQCNWFTRLWCSSTQESDTAWKMQWRWWLLGVPYLRSCNCLVTSSRMWPQLSFLRYRI